MRRGVGIEDTLKPLATHPTQCYLTNVLQVADVLEWVLSQVGRATVWQTSFSISEEFLRRLYFIEKSGRVDTIHLILDFKATQKTLRLWAMAVPHARHRTHLFGRQPLQGHPRSLRCGREGLNYHFSEPYTRKPYGVGCRLNRF